MSKFKHGDRVRFKSDGDWRQLKTNVTYTILYDEGRDSWFVQINDRFVSFVSEILDECYLEQEYLNEQAMKKALGLINE